MTCEHAHLDAAYVLGSLSPGERLDFERHLSGCARCSRAVRELAGIPGLLASVDARDLEPDAGAPLPPTLLPSLVREVRRSQRRRSIVVAAVAAAVTAVAVGALAVGSAGGDDGPPTAVAPSRSVASPPVGTEMEAVGDVPVSADVLVAGVAWGTRLDLRCSYTEEEDEYPESPSADYALVVRTRDGRAEQVATWRGLPGRTMHVSGATATSRDEIDEVEVRTGDGVVVLRLPV